jgi:hypothetical protein
MTTGRVSVRAVGGKKKIFEKGRSLIIKKRKKWKDIRNIP